MIYMTRTGAIAPGKSAAAHAFAQKVATYWKTEWDRTLDIRRPIGGNPNRIAWVGQYKDLADFETATVKSLADPKYMEAFNKVWPGQDAGKFIQNTESTRTLVKNELWLVIDYVDRSNTK